jgi:CBS domain-containing protein
VQNATVKMAELSIGGLLVIDHEQVVGIFTERDVVNKLFKNRLNPDNVTVAEVMTRKLIFASLTTTIKEAMEIFTEQRFRHLPVMDNGHLVGLVSSGDVTKWIITNLQSEVTTLADYIRGENYR